MQTNKPPRHRRTRFTLSTYILLGVVMGILSGIFFGEYCAPLGSIGNAFIGLLQMTILPYIIVSLILAIGSLRYGQTGLLAVRASVLQRMFRGIVFAIILLMLLSFPKWESASCRCTW